MPSCFMGGNIPETQKRFVSKELALPPELSGIRQVGHKLERSMIGANAVLEPEYFPNLGF